MTLRLPAFGARFREKRLKGWDPQQVVLVGINLWLGRHWTRDHTLVVTSEHPALRLDFRMLAGCQVAVVTGFADEPLARAVIERLVRCDPEQVELIVWDAGRLYEVLLPAPTREELIASGFSAAQAIELERPTYYGADSHARRYWLREAAIAARARAATEERAGLAA